nr:hypothetical protein CFP56_28863 [Quercus suber]
MLRASEYERTSDMITRWSAEAVRYMSNTKHCALVSSTYVEAAASLTFMLGCEQYMEISGIPDLASTKWNAYE